MSNGAPDHRQGRSSAGTGVGPILTDTVSKPSMPGNRGGSGRYPAPQSINNAIDKLVESSRNIIVHDHFDVQIYKQLTSMPEEFALRALETLMDTRWETVKRPTPFIMRRVNHYWNLFHDGRSLPEDPRHRDHGGRTADMRHRQMPAFDPWLSDHFGQAHNLGGPMMMAHAMQPPWMGDLPLSPGMGVPGRVSDSTIAMSALAGLRFARGGSSEYTTDLNESGLPSVAASDTELQSSAQLLSQLQSLRSAQGYSQQFLRHHLSRASAETYLPLSNQGIPTCLGPAQRPQIPTSIACPRCVGVVSQLVMLTRQGLLSPAFLATVGLTEPRPDAGGQAALCVCAALRERGSEIEMALSALSNLVPGMTARAPSKAPEQVPPVTMPQGMGVNPVDPGLRAHLRVLRSGEMQGPFAPPPTQAQAAQHRMSDTAAIGAMGMAPPPTFPMYQGAQYQGAHPSDQQRGQLSHMDVATLAKMAASVGLSAQDIYKAATGASAQETEVGSLSGAPSAQENDVLSTMGSLGQHDTQTPFGTFAAGAAGETSPLDLSPLGHSLAELGTFAQDQGNPDRW